MTIGIYAIYFEKLDKVYIGQSINIESRFTTHRSLLKLGHYNYKLHEAYILDSNPLFIVLVECSIQELNSLEINLIKEFNSVEDGLNILSGGTTGIHGYYSPRCKSSREELIYAFTLLGNSSLTLGYISSITGLKSSMLSSLIKGSRHIWLHEEFPVLAQMVRNNKYSRLSNAQENRYKTNYILVSPEGVEYICTNRNKFAKEHNLNSGHLGAVCRGSELQHKGWTLKKGVSTK